MAYKRKRVYAGRPAKKRRMMKRRTARRRRSTMTSTSRSLNPNSAFRPQGRKMSRRRWRNVLWRDTLAMEHYKTIASDAITLNTPSNIFSLQMTSVLAFDDTANSEFWKINGGLQDSGFGFVPLWGQPNGAGIPELVSLVIRGGRFWCTVANPSTTDNVKVRVQLAYIKASLRNITDTGVSNTAADWLAAIIPGNRPITWNIAEAPDYSQYFYQPVVDKIVDLKPGDDMNVVQKVKPVKIDCDKYRRGAGYFPIWFIYGSQNVDNTVGGSPINVITGYNMSFSVTDVNT